MRHRQLIRSVDQLLGPGSHHATTHAAYVWSRHHWVPVVAVLVAVVVGVGAAVVGFDGWTAPVALGGVAAAVLSFAATDYAVIALTTDGPLVCRGSRFRQRATAIVEWPAASWHPTEAGGNLIIHDWLIDGRRWSAGRRHHRELQIIAGAANR